MKDFFNRLYLSTFISSFGNWLTFLAIALMVKENHGGQHVAWVFLAQTLPALIFSRSLAKLIPEHRHGIVFFWCHIFLAINSGLLCLFTSLPFIYAHLFFGALIKSISSPILNTLVGRWCTGTTTEITFTRIGSIQTATLALAPALGAWLKVATSAQVLFFVDAVAYVSALALISERLLIQSEPSKTTTAQISGESRVEQSSSVGRDKQSSSVSVHKQSFSFISKVSFRDSFGSIVGLPIGVTRILWVKLAAWFGFLALGALLNALEFARFEQLRLTETQIGQVMAAWGVGSFVAFVFRKNYSAMLSGVIFLFALVGFLLAPSIYLLLVSFGVGGWAASVFSGTLRGQIQHAVPLGMNALPIWVFANQVTQGINLIAYVGVGLLLSTLGYKVFAIFVILIGIATLVVVASPSLFNIYKKVQVQP